MRGYLVYLLIVKYLLIWFKFSHSISDWRALSWNGGGLKTFLEGSVHYIIYRDYTANRRSLIYCNLATGLLRFGLTPCFSSTGSHPQSHASSYTNINNRCLYTAQKRKTLQGAAEAKFAQ